MSAIVGDNTFHSKVQDLVSPEDPEKVLELLNAVGSGAFGVVYKAKDKRSNRVVAVKKMQLNESNIADIRRELCTLQEIKCPSCVEYLGSYFKDGNLFLTMEFFEGGSIGDILVTKKSLSEPQIGAVIAQTIPAIDYLHSINKLHRDIKAANLLLNPAGVIKLCDFGITTTIEAGQKRQTQIGSPFWMAPEIISGDGYDQKADIWSLGITAFEMAESQHPFFDLNPMTAMFQIVQDPVPKLTQLTIWSSGFLNFIDQCLDKNPETRMSIKQVSMHPWVKKFQHPNARQPLIQLFNEVCVPKQAKPAASSSPGGSGIRPGGSGEAPKPPEQGIVKFAMPDKSFRSLLVQRDETAREVGLEDTESYSLYYTVGNEEKCLNAEDKPLQIQKEKNVPYFTFKETPDINAYNQLMAIFANLKNAPNKYTSILRSQQDVRSLVQVILSQNLSVVTALCEIVPETSKDALVQALVPLFESQHQTPRLLKRIGKREISSTENLPNLLRSQSSLLCKMLSTYGKLVAGKYLRKLLPPIIREVMAMSETIELDTKRMTSLDLKAQLQKLTVNIQKMTALAKNLLQAILSSLPDLPPQMCYVCRDLQIICSHFFRFESKYIVPYSFLFGQLICPAIVSPRLFGIIEETPPPDASRTLIYLSKTLLGLASGKEFDTEDYMSVMNVFIAENKAAMENFLEQVLKREPLPPSTRVSHADIAPVDLQKAVIFLASILDEKKIELGRAMNVLPRVPRPGAA